MEPQEFRVGDRIRVIKIQNDGIRSWGVKVGQEGKIKEFYMSDTIEGPSWRIDFDNGLGGGNIAIYEICMELI